MKKTMILAIILAMAVSVVYAQSVPPLINYQGMLTGTDGNPLTGTKKLVFNIYDAVSGGNLIWGPQTFDSVPLIEGRFNVILGTTDTPGRSIANAFDAANRYLGITVDGAEIAPRQQILSAPFAVQAEHATKADNSSEAVHAQKADIAVTVQGSNLYVDSNGNVGVGTTNPAEKLDVNGGIKVNDDLKAENNQWGSKESTSTDGIGGHSWVLTETKCPNGSYVVGIRIQYRGTCNSECNSDGGVIGGIEIICRDL